MYLLSTSGNTRKYLNLLISFSEIALIVTSYLLGCFNTAYYLTKSKLKQDIRSLGSTNAGAKNVGRVLGRSGFVLTFLGDFLKGAIAVLAARYLEFGDLASILVLLAVVAGHILPVQLSFKGGKGLATTLAGLLVLDFRLALILVAMTGISNYITKNDHLSVAAVIVIAPIVAHFLGHSFPTIFGLIILSVLILFSHRHDLRKTMTAKFA